MHRTFVTAILGIVLALGLTLGLGWGLTHLPEGGAPVVPPMLAAAMLGIGLLLIGAGFYRRN